MYVERDRIVTVSTGKLRNVGSGSPNRLLYKGSR